MTVEYFISGRLPATWEDFIPENGFEKFPKVTISCGHEKESISDLDENGWCDVEIMGDTLTTEAAINILSIICGQNIKINERDFCQSV